MRLDVVDLSHHNATPNFVTAANNGLIGVIHKATEGTSFTDEDYHHRQLEAADAGLKWASYHFLRHGSVEQQMSHYLSFAEPADGERVVIDYEHQDCTLDDLHRAIAAIIDADPTLQITIYAGHLIKEQLGNKLDPALAPHSLWIAQYNNSAPSWPTGTWPTYTLWQYSDGSVGGSPKNMPGIPSPHDCNQFNGSQENCAKWFGPATDEQPEPEPAPEHTVSVSIATPDEVSVVISVNGEQWRKS